ncbi:hypothetical protein HDU83_007476 [Entophlyctis luteolus]|nr:hypothetical protein HDU83_007476 [Entophlyctis luteolus]
MGGSFQGPSKRYSLAQAFAGNHIDVQPSPASNTDAIPQRKSPVSTRPGSRVNSRRNSRANSVIRQKSLAVIERTDAAPQSSPTIPVNPHEYETAVLAATSSSLSKSGRSGAINLIRSLDANSTEPWPIQNALTALVTVDSDVPEFRSYHNEIAHPAIALNLVSGENDRTVYTEFDSLCNELLSNLADFEAALEELTIWKDDFITQSVPSTVKLQLTMLFARLFRSKSVMHEPLFELIRQVRLYSRPWVKKQDALYELEKDYQRQTHVLDVAIRKLEQLQSQTQRLKSDKKLALWERLCHKIFAVYIDDFVESKDPPIVPDGDNLNAQTSSIQLPLLPVNSQSQLAAATRGVVRSRTTSNLKQTSQQPSATAGQSMQSLKRKIFHELKSELIRVADEIQQYIATPTPSWFKQARTAVSDFTTILTRHFPHYREDLMRLHQNPYPRHATHTLHTQAYASVQKGTISIRRAIKPNLPRAWSLPDLRKFTRRDSVAPRLRANSANMVTSSLLLRMRVRNIPALLATPEDAADDGDYRNVARHITPPKSPSDGLCTDDDLHEKAESHRDFGSEYFGEFDSRMIDDLIERYMNPTNEKILEQDIIGSSEDPQGDTFTMQDVMELTLLHAQQMHLMQKEYEDKIRAQDLQMEIMKQNLEDADREFESKMRQANERAQRLAQKYMAAGNAAGGGGGGGGIGNAGSGVDAGASVDSMARAAEGKMHAKRGGAKTDDDRSNASDDEDGKRRGKKKQSKNNKKQSIVKEFDVSRLAHRKPTAVAPKPVIKLHKNEHSVKKKVFTGAPFSMTFIERLRWFTDERIKKMRELQDKLIAPEIAANEERLNQLKLIRRHKNLIEDSEYRDAEFVPYPGQVPAFKMKRAWAEHYAKVGVGRPWISRFQSMQDKLGTGKPNVLNLFDVALQREASRRQLPASDAEEQG